MHAEFHTHDVHVVNGCRCMHMEAVYQIVKRILGREKRIGIPMYSYVSCKHFCSVGYLNN